MAGAYNNVLEGTTPYYYDDRDFGQFSDHVTVWLDKYIGLPNTCNKLKEKFDQNIQVLHSNNNQEIELDDESMVCTDPALLEKLKEDVYCLKYFSAVDDCLNYIQTNTQKRIFFISSGSMGQIIVPQIVGLTNIKAIYIFCGNIAAHTEWANDYVDYISGMLIHQDDLLERVAGDIAQYLDAKGDEYRANEDRLKARNCYSWAQKLFTRARQLGSNTAIKSIDAIGQKLAELQSSSACRD